MEKETFSLVLGQWLIILLIIIIVLSITLFFFWGMFQVTGASYEKQYELCLKDPQQTNCYEKVYGK